MHSEFPLSAPAIVSDFNYRTLESGTTRQFADKQQGGGRTTQYAKERAPFDVRKSACVPACTRAHELRSHFRRVGAVFPRGKQQHNSTAQHIRRWTLKLHLTAGLCVQVIMELFGAQESANTICNSHNIKLCAYFVQQTPAHAHARQSKRNYVCMHRVHLPVKAIAFGARDSLASAGQVIHSLCRATMFISGAMFALSRISTSICLLSSSFFGMRL